MPNTKKGGAAVYGQFWAVWNVGLGPRTYLGPTLTLLVLYREYTDYCSKCFLGPTRIVSPTSVRFVKTVRCNIFLLFFLFFPLLSFFAFFSFLFFFFLSLFFSLVPFFNGLVSVVRMHSNRYYVQYTRGSLSWAASGIDGFFQARVVRRMHQYGPGTS